MTAQSSVFFPEPMDRITIVCPTESTYQCMRAINDFGYVQFDDHNTGTKSLQKRYSEPFMQAEEAERSLRFLKTILESHELLPQAPSYDEVGGVENDNDFNQIVEQINSTANDARERKRIFDDLQNEIEMREQKLSCLRFFREVVHQHNVPPSSGTPDSEAYSATLLQTISTDNMFIVSVVCYIPAEKARRFVTTVFRLSRRNVIVNSGEIQDGQIPFALFASSPSIMERIKKVAESYGTNVFEFQQDDNTLDQIESELTADLNQMKAVNEQTLGGNLSFLQDVAVNIWGWVSYIAREKLTFATMDCGNFEETEGSVVYTGWCPTRYMPQLTELLNRTSRISVNPVPIHVHSRSVTLLNEDDEMPPTLIETNDFTYSFQCLNDAYGIPNYDELNGGAFYCTYPFLFGIMFGDMGHAFIYFLAAIAIFILDPIIKRKKIDLGDIGGSLFSFKWLVLFASICAFYCGFIYDEMFGLPVNFFGSHYVQNETNPMYYNKKDAAIYPFGIDPVWFFKDNELILMNSYKMKLAVVMGMTQMIFGLFLGLINHIHRRDITEILVTWIPQFLYLVPFFGYLVVLIIKKWCTDFSQNPDEVKQKDGVNLIQVMIAIILSFGSKDETLDLYGDTQWIVQKIILYIFVLSIPMLLFLRPIVDIVKKHGKPGFNLLEVFVMNLIGVIEFCLGALSHTASYLRLWALSLAHSQLSHVLYEELMIITINSGNCILIAVGFAGYVLMTIAILLGMEAFSALLHGIRLMWVEFSSKFYKGMGFEFKPASTKDALKAALS
ncbi:hypothetical protein M9Y10_008200 [Tritrichomonas musculus]|uniref:V-type proton ATPase subunit a n=1 Tax=Tritrichomonas musculus TaxID=1915356 RepID=A0ABR2IXU6_9EUKA